MRERESERGSNEQLYIKNFDYFNENISRKENIKTDTEKIVNMNSLM